MHLRGIQALDRARTYQWLEYDYAR
jgi:hypothetical protein